MMMRSMVVGLGRRSLRQLHTFIHLQKETIRPSSPTPSHLRTYNLSLFDQFNPSLYMPVVFFYPNNNHPSTISNQAKTAQLKNSLSQILTHYYPFSGRLVTSTNGGAYVDCNDEGVEFLEVQTDASFSELVHLLTLGYQPLDQFFPTGTVWDLPSNGWGSPVMVQITYFHCGGIAVAVSMSHKIGDASTLLSFLNHWARLCANDKVQDLEPPLIVSSPKADFSSLQETVFEEGNNCVIKKFVFPNSKLARLKDKVKELNPTRNEVLTSLLYGCAVRAAMANSFSNSFKGYILRHLVNLRKQMVNSLPKTIVGNKFTCNFIPTMNESELAMNSLTARIKNAKLQARGVTPVQMDQFVIQLVEARRNRTSANDFGSYLCTSVCNFPAYEVNFGWGKPVRMTIPGCPKKNILMLMDTPNGDGIEALVILEEEEMAIFQKDGQLLEFVL